LQDIDPNIGPPPAQRHATSISQAPFRPSTINPRSILPVNLPASPVQPLQPIRVGPPPPIQPSRPAPVQPTPVDPPPNSFLPADQWQRIHNFQAYMTIIEMETYT